MFDSSLCAVDLGPAFLTYERNGATLFFLRVSGKDTGPFLRMVLLFIGALGHSRRRLHFWRVLRLHHRIVRKKKAADGGLLELLRRSMNHAVRCLVIVGFTVVVLGDEESR